MFNDINNNVTDLNNKATNKNDTNNNDIDNASYNYVLQQSHGKCNHKMCLMVSNYHYYSIRENQQFYLRICLVTLAKVV